MNPENFVYEKRPHFVSTSFAICVTRRARTILLTALFWSACLLAAPGSSFAQAALTDDADSNKGTVATLNLANGVGVFIKFNITSTLPANTPGSRVAKATMKLYVSTLKSPGTIDVFQIVNSWSERNISASQPIPGDLVQSGVVVHPDQEGKFIVFDVTPAVQQWLGTDGSGTGGAPNNGVAIVARDGASLTFDSKENLQTSHEAQLNIQLVDETGPGGTVTNVSATAPLSVTNPTTTPNISLGIVPATNGGTGLIWPGAATDFRRNEGVSWNSAPLSAADLPPGSLQYVQNSAVLQPATQFNIARTGKAAAFDAATQFNLGGNRILSQPGTANLFAGTGAGAINAGQSNAFFGDSAGLSNTNGDFCSFFGAGAGRANTAGDNNSFFGSNAGLSNTTAFQNSFFGRY